MHVELISKSWLSRSIDVFTDSGTFRVEYDGIGLDKAELGSDYLLVNGVTVAKSRNWLSLSVTFAFELGPLPAVLEVRARPWLTLRVRLIVDGDVVYDDATRTLPKEQKPRQRASVVWRLSGIGVIFLGLLCVRIGKTTAADDQGFIYEFIQGFAIAAVGGLLVFVGVWIFNFGRRANAVSAQETTSRDSRAPVLYLRPFKSDSSEGTLPLFSSHIPLTFATEEEQLARVFSEIGPFTAIGQPDEEFPHLGAIRTYPGHDEWRNTVRSLMVQAQLVVFRAGAGSEGFWWEVETAVTSVRPERLLFLVPGDKREDDAFRSRVQKYVPSELPTFSGKIPFLWNIQLKGLLYFEPDWTPHYVRLDGKFDGGGDRDSPVGHTPARRKLHNPFMPYVAIFNMALQPVFDQLRAAGQPPPRP